MKIAFLCGAGASIPCGMPCTREITERVLNGDGVVRHTDLNYYFMKPLQPSYSEYVARVCGFLRILKAECNRFFQEDHETNYEDLYYLARQIYDSEAREYENPAVQPLIEKIGAMKDFKQLLDTALGDLDGIRGFARESCNYIECVVWRMLNKAQSSLSPLGFIQELHADDSIERMDVYSLNHDTVFERFCEANDLPFADGFGPKKNSNRSRGSECIGKQFFG